MGPRRWSVLAAALLLSLGFGVSAGRGQSTGGTAQGLVEISTATTVRPRPTAAEIAAFVPATRGSFSFPQPYGTTGFRITVPADCGGRDCVRPAGYAYWRNMNNHSGSSRLYMFLGLARQTGGEGPTLFSLDTTTGAVAKVGPLFTPEDPRSWSTGDGWYFSGTSPSTLYVHASTDPRLVRYDIWSRQSTTVFDLSAQTAVFGPGAYPWQAHSSDDDRTHSFTVRVYDGSVFTPVGCGAHLERTNEFRLFRRVSASPDDYDECQVDRSGRWLVIKEQVDGRYGPDNRIIDLQTGRETTLLDERGAGGHSDVGYGYMVAMDNWYAAPAFRLWRFDSLPGTGPVVYRDATWASESIVHVSHLNARPGPAEPQYACGSGAGRVNGPRVGEISCFFLDGSLNTLVVAPVMTDLDAPGGGNEYDRLPKGNLDSTGRYFLWTTNLGGSRLDAFVVRVPANDGFTPRLTAAPRAPVNVRIVQ